MKKKFMLAIAVIMVLGSVKAMAMSEEEAASINTLSKIEAVERSSSVEQGDFNDTKIAAMQIDDMKRMIKDMIQMQEEADLLFAEDAFPRVGQLYKLVEEADLTYMAANNSNSGAKINSAWLYVQSLKKSACGIVSEADLQVCK